MHNCIAVNCVKKGGGCQHIARLQDIIVKFVNPLVVQVLLPDISLPQLEVGVVNISGKQVIQLLGVGGSTIRLLASSVVGGERRSSMSVID